MVALTATIHGPPVPKGRPRLGAGGRTYTPERTRAWEAACRAHVGLAVARHRACRGADWPLTATYRASVDVARARQAGDLDNYCKAVLDACNGLLWRDDSQVHELRARYVDGVPRVELTVEVLGAG